MTAKLLQEVPSAKPMRRQRGKNFSFRFKNLFITLWTLLFIVPGIIKSFEYWAIDFILAVRPDIDRKEAFRLSKLLMNGNKMESFVLDLSFWGWNILAAYSMGILGIIYVYPYMNATYVEFYAYVRALALQKGLITPMDLPDYEAPSMNMGFDFAPQQETGFAQPQQGFYQPQENYNQPQESYNQAQEPFDNN